MLDSEQRFARNGSPLARAAHDRCSIGTVFICSSYEDLVEERKRVIEVAEDLGYHVLYMEEFNAHNARTGRVCLDYVGMSDLLIVLIGCRYGSIVPGRNISFTEAEYVEACRLGKPCLVYYRDASVPVLQHMIEDGKPRKELARWKSVLMRDHTAASFRDAHLLGRLVTKALTPTSNRSKRDQHSDDPTRRPAVLVPQDAHSREMGALLGEVDRLAQRVEMKRSFGGRRELELDRSDVVALFNRYIHLCRTRDEPNLDVLDGIARLSLAAGSPVAALKRFDELAELCKARGDREGEAEARFNQHRAALEVQDFDLAAQRFREARELVPGRYVVFPPRYRMVKVIGTSAAGVDFLCLDTEYNNANRIVRAQLIDDLDEEDRQELFGTIGLLSKFKHRHVVNVVDCGWADLRARRAPYVVFKPFLGETLEKSVAAGPLSPKAFLVLAMRLASALDAAHQLKLDGGEKLIHREVRPANVLVSWRVEAGRRELKGTQLVGFGLALSPIQRLGYQGAENCGADAYLAPEQLGKLDSTPVSVKSDMVGFARTCFYAFFGTPAPQPDAFAQMPATIAAVLRQCVEQAPGRRPESMKAVYDQLRAFTWDDLLQWNERWWAAHQGGGPLPPTPHRVQCPNCNTVLKVAPAGQASQMLRCPACLQVIQVATGAEGDLLARPAFPWPCPACKRQHWVVPEATVHPVSCSCSARFVPGPCRLVVTEGGHRNRSWRLRMGKSSIGRADGDVVPTIDLPEPSDRLRVSRDHALIVVVEGSITIEDKGSSNGTFVNQTRIPSGKQIPLRLGDKLQIGSVSLRLVLP